MEGNVFSLWNGTVGRIKANAMLFGDDGNRGDEYLYKDEYPLKLSWNNQPTLEEDAFMPVKIVELAL